MFEEVLGDSHEGATLRATADAACEIRVDGDRCVTFWAFKFKHF